MKQVEQLHRLQHYDFDLLLREEEFVREKVASKPFQVGIFVQFSGNVQGPGVDFFSSFL